MGRSALWLVLASALVGCRSPTQISVDVQADVQCSQVTETAFTAGELGAIESLPPTSTSTTCSGEHLGTVVLVPSGDENAQVGFKLVTALNGVTTDVCSSAAAANNTNCIVERRALRYIPNTPLEVVVEMTKACEGTICNAESTCVNGVCVPATIPDPTQCEGATGCTSSVLTPDDGGVSPVVDAGPDATVDSGVDSGVDATVDSGVDATVASGVDATVDSGVDATVDSGVDAADAGASTDTGAEDAAPDAEAGGIDDAGACTAGAQECASDAAVRMCTIGGQWGGALPCATGECSAGACVGATSGSAFPSCAGGGSGKSDCGEDGGDDCCESLEVPGGTYTRTEDDGVTTSATVNALRLDKYLVTVGRFRQFMTAWDGGSGLTGGGGFVPDAGSGKHSYLNGGLGLIDVGVDAGLAYESGWLASDDSKITRTDAVFACASADSDWTSTPLGQETLPMNCVGWEEAVAFCIWDGGFLPSEAEWTFAAAGGTDQRTYPWGPSDPSTAVNQYAIYGALESDGGYVCLYPTGDPLGACDGGNIAPVGSAPLGLARWGQLDMGGDVAEWMRDIYWFYADACIDCAYMTGTNQYWSVRGGDFRDDTTYLESQWRNYSSWGSRASWVGFRCARAP
jgi:formylglycine-generating enzyme required for sulfatase activity